MNRKSIIPAIILILFSLSLLNAQGRGRGKGMQNKDNCKACIEMPSQELDQKEIDALLYMREEEKLARDVYVAFLNKWDMKIFRNISESESRHTISVKNLLDKYKISDPVTSDSVGVFTNPGLQKLYHDLVKRGQDSLVSALTVGAIIEDLDIYDLNQRLAEVDNDDIKCVFENLKRGSENHMRAFNRQLDRNGGTYKAQYISQNDLDQILKSENSKGHQKGKGRGKGKGRNKINN